MGLKIINILTKNTSITQRITRNAVHTPVFSQVGNTSCMSELLLKCKQEVNAIIKSNKNLNQIHIVSGAKQFVKETNGDYELLLKLLKNEKIINSDYLNSLLKISNKNNISFLRNYIENPASIVSNSNTKNGDLMVLNFLMSLNRNNPIPTELLTNTNAQKLFLNNAFQLPMKACSKNSDKLMRAFFITKSGGYPLKSGIKPATLNKNLLDDWENLAHGRSYIKQFDNETIPEIVRSVKYGDAFSIKGQMYIKEANGKLTPLGYSEDTYKKLFPPIDRFNICQGNYGDCYFVSVMDSLMSNPEGRNTLYKMFKGSTENKILVSKNPNKYVPYEFREFDKKGMHVYNENAFGILEQYAARNKGLSQHKQFESIEEMMENFRGGQSMFAGRYLLDLDNTGKTINEFAHNETELRKLLENNINKSGKIFMFGTKDKAFSTAESTLSEDYFLFSTHAGAIKAYNPATDTAVITNPWISAAEFEIPIADLMRYVNKDGVCCTSIV